MSQGEHSYSFPHDRFFRSYFQRPDILQALVKFVLPAEVATTLDFSKLHIEDACYIRQEEREWYADLSATVGLTDMGAGSDGGASEGTNSGESYHSGMRRSARVYVLFDHKSYTDRWLPFQLHRYQMEIWEKEKRAKKPLSRTIAIAIHHGRSSRVFQSFESLFPAGDPGWLKQLTPSVPMTVVNLAALPESAMPLAPPALAAGLWALKTAHSGLATMLSRLDMLAGRWGKELVRDNDFGKVVQYMAYVAPEQADEFKDRVEEIVDNTLLQEEMMTSLAENLIQKGWNEGRQKGREEGLEEAREEKAEQQRKTADRLIDRGFSVEEVAELTDLSIDEVREIAAERKQE